MSDVDKVLLAIAAIVVVVLGIRKTYYRLKEAEAADKAQAEVEIEASKERLERMEERAKQDREDISSMVNLLAEIRDKIGTPDPEMKKTAESLAAHVSALDASAIALKAEFEKVAPGLEKLSDHTFLIARGSRDISDQVAALRAVVFGGRRAEEMPITVNDTDGVRRAEFEYDVANLMQDHGLSRIEAERRVKDQFVRIPR